MGRRTQADGDAITVEIGYAFLSGCFAAALVFGAVFGPAPAFSLPRSLARPGTARHGTPWPCRAGSWPQWSSLSSCSAPRTSSGGSPSPGERRP
ncbi:DUF6332 family protein [Streptomyces sp. APSN-46.1]|uniref:DUF6332 family protein n=1 Tax=Streptomyces sp. APSN-46.1 TaxID=2929049 RepID=UPI0035AC155B